MITDTAIIVALDEEGGFAKDFKIPWQDQEIFKEDLARFKELTYDNIVVMGRHTYEEIHEMKMANGGRKEDPLLSGRVSYVLSRNEEFIPHGATRIGWFRGLLYQDIVMDPDTQKKLFVLGGGKLFIEVLPYVSEVYCTIVKGFYDCDKFFPINELVKKFEITEGSETPNTYYVHYKRIAQ